MRVALLLTLVTLTGCHNACQDICVEMASYAEDCGTVVPDGQTKDCIKANAGKEITKAQREVCQDQVDAIREEWTCEDLKIYYNPQGSGGTTGDDTGQ